MAQLFKIVEGGKKDDPPEVRHCPDCRFFVKQSPSVGRLYAECGLSGHWINNERDKDAQRGAYCGPNGDWFKPKRTFWQIIRGWK